MALLGFAQPCLRRKFSTTWPEYDQWKDVRVPKPSAPHIFLSASNL